MGPVRVSYYANQSPRGLNDSHGRCGQEPRQGPHLEQPYRNLLAHFVLQELLDQDDAAQPPQYMGIVVSALPLCLPWPPIALNPSLTSLIPYGCIIHLLHPYPRMLLFFPCSWTGIRLCPESRMALRVASSRRSSVDSINTLTIQERGSVKAQALDINGVKGCQSGGRSKE